MENHCVVDPPTRNPAGGGRSQQRDILLGLKRGHFTLPTGKAALKGFRMMIFREIDRDNDNFSVLLVRNLIGSKKCSSSHILISVIFWVNSAPRNVTVAVRMFASSSRFASDLSLPRCLGCLRIPIVDPFMQTVCNIHYRFQKIAVYGYVLGR